VILLTSIPKSQHERSPDPEVQGHGLVGEAAVERSLPQTASYAATGARSCKRGRPSC
jgi:hypothetical protein